MDIVDFEHEVVQVTVAVSFSFNELDLIVDALHHCRRYPEVEVIEDTYSMPA